MGFEVRDHEGQGGMKLGTGTAGTMAGSIW